MSATSKDTAMHHGGIFVTGLPEARVAGAAAVMDWN